MLFVRDHVFRLHRNIEADAGVARRPHLLSETTLPFGRLVGRQPVLDAL